MLAIRSCKSGENDLPVLTLHRNGFALEGMFHQRLLGSDDLFQIAVGFVGKFIRQADRKCGRPIVICFCIGFF